MNKRWISLILAALMLLSLLPTAFAAQQPDGAQIDTAALAARMNRSDSVRLSETASPKQSPVPTAAAKTADESKPNEIYPHPSQDGMGVVLGDVARIDYSLVIYPERYYDYYCVVIFRGTEMRDENYIGEYTDKCTDRWGDVGYEERSLSWDTGVLNQGTGTYTAYFFIANIKNGQYVPIEETVYAITIELRSSAVSLKGVYFADENDNAFTSANGAVGYPTCFYGGFTPRNATCSRDVQVTCSDAKMLIDQFAGVYYAVPTYPGSYDLKMEKDGKTATLRINVPDPSGKCGPDVAWSFSSKNDTLYISGTGDMYHYNEDNAPWEVLKPYIKNVVIGSGVTNVGRFIFFGCENMRSVTIPDTVTDIAEGAFNGCKKLTRLTLPRKLKTIGPFAFANCDSLKQLVIPAGVTEIGNSAFVCDSGSVIGEFYFMGNAPKIGEYAFVLVRDETVLYYNEGAEGWTTPDWNGYPTKPCNPSYPPLFNDVYRGDWFFDAVRYATEHRLMGGTGVALFDPEGSMTRAMLVTVLWRYEGSPAEGANGFTDVPEGQWYTQAVAWAAENKIVGGVGHGRFDPEGEITREQMATILFRYAQFKGIDVSKRGDLTAFPDGNAVANWAKEAVQWAVGEGIIGGSDGKLLPQGSATRAQVATILMRFIENIANK